MTHFQKLKQIASSSPEPSFPLRPADQGDLLDLLFNSAYALLLLTLQELYSEADVKNTLNQRMYVVMEKVMRPVGLYMAQHTGTGPSFSGVEFPQGTSPVNHVKSLIQTVLEKYPAIEKLKVALQKL